MVVWRQIVGWPDTSGVQCRSVSTELQEDYQSKQLGYQSKQLRMYDGRRRRKSLMVVGEWAWSRGCCSTVCREVECMYVECSYVCRV